MPLTRRRSDNPRQETWFVYFDDIQVGSIGERVGIPTGVHRWQWSCGFYGLNPGQHSYGTASTFAKARAGFEADWQRLLPEIPESSFDEYRDDRDLKAAIRAKHARGEKLDSEVPTSMMCCVCGVRFDSHDPELSYVHRQHIYARRRDHAEQLH